MHVSDKRLPHVVSLFRDFLIDQGMLGAVSIPLPTLAAAKRRRPFDVSVDVKNCRDGRVIMAQQSVRKRWVKIEEAKKVTSKKWKNIPRLGEAFCVAGLETIAAIWNQVSVGVDM
jgi:hypothetical protein